MSVRACAVKNADACARPSRPGTPVSRVIEVFSTRGRVSIILTAAWPGLKLRSVGGDAGPCAAPQSFIQ